MEIEIRHIEKSDVEAVKDIYDQPHVEEGTLQLPYQSTDMWMSRLDALTNFIGLVAVVDEKVVGHLGVHTTDRHRRKHVASLVIAVCASVQGKGIAKKLMSAAIDLCDNWLNIRKIELQVYVDNERAIALYKKFGFEIEGELKEYGFKAGKYVSAYAMGRVKEI
ncbi:MAG: GNAT family N-acetyltransferase [Gammaproteobacteria bacterium]|nr:GNAT family N-acetyltransferase [Gammaproteobacteria bacterium]